MFRCFFAITFVWLLLYGQCFVFFFYFLNGFATACNFYQKFLSIFIYIYFPSKSVYCSFTKTTVFYKDFFTRYFTEDDIWKWVSFLADFAVVSCSLKFIPFFTFQLLLLIGYTFPCYFYFYQFYYAWIVISFVYYFFFFILKWHSFLCCVIFRCWNQVIYISLKSKGS